MKTESEENKLRCPGVIEGRRPSGAFEPDRESGPDARMQLCTAQRIVAFAARQRAREGKSSFFPASIARGKGDSYEVTLPLLRRNGCT